MALTPLDIQKMRFSAEDAGLRPARGRGLPGPGGRGAGRAARAGRPAGAREPLLPPAPRRGRRARAPAPADAAAGAEGLRRDHRHRPARGRAAGQGGRADRRQDRAAGDRAVHPHRGEDPGAAHQRRELQLKFKNTLDLFQRILEAEMEDERSDRHRPHPAAQAARRRREPAPPCRPARRRLFPHYDEADLDAGARAGAARSPACWRTATPPTSPGCRRVCREERLAAWLARARRPPALARAAAPSGRSCSGVPAEPPPPARGASCGRSDARAISKSLAPAAPSELAGAARRARPGPRTSTSPARRRWRSTSATGRCATST